MLYVPVYRNGYPVDRNEGIRGWVSKSWEWSTKRPASC
jgi:hypothetical protein